MEIINYCVYLWVCKLLQFLLRIFGNEVTLYHL